MLSQSCFLSILIFALSSGSAFASYGFDVDDYQKEREKYLNRLPPEEREKLGDAWEGFYGPVEKTRKDNNWLRQVWKGFSKRKPQYKASDA